MTEQHNQLGGTVLGPAQASDTGVAELDTPMPAPEVPAEPPTEPPSGPSAHLPAGQQLDGRATELTMLATALATDREPAGRPVVCVIAGPAGVGKTALAVQAARADETALTGGILFVDLHGHDPARRLDAHAALSVLLRQLDVPGDRVPERQADREVLFRSVLSDLALAGRPVLVLADNAATLDQILPLWPGAPEHRMLVTSRSPLPIPGARRLELGVLSDEDAVAVLEHVTRAADPDDDRISADPAAAARLATLCAGLPLALRITAGMVAVRREESLTALADAMSPQQDQQAEETEPRPIRSVFEAAHSRLDPEQARLFRLLTLDPGTDVDIDAAAALLDADRDTAGELMNGLLAAHLVYRTPGGYGLHDLLRGYAAERCRADEPEGPRTEAVRRLLLRYRSRVEEAGSHLDPQVPAESRRPRFADQAAAVAWLDAHWRNLVAAVPLAAGEGLDTVARDIPLGLLSYFDLRGHLAEWAATSQFAVAAARRLDDPAGEAAARNSLGLAYLASQRYTEAGECFDGAARLYEGVEDRRGLAAAVTNAGTTEHHLRRFTEAIIHFERALALYRELDDLHGEASTLANLAGSHTDLGQLDEALDNYQRAAALFAATDDRQREGRILADVGNVQLRLGRPEKALDSHLRALALHRGIGDPHEEALTLLGLGNDHEALGHVTEALEAQRRAITLSRQLGDRRTEWRGLVYLGNVECRRRRFAEAVRAYRDAVVICRDLGESVEEGRALGNLGTAYAQWGRLAEALDIHREALAILRRAGDRYGEGVALADLGAVHRDLGQRTKASDCYLRAVAAFHEVDAADDVARVERLLADLARLQA